VLDARFRGTPRLTQKIMERLSNSYQELINQVRQEFQTVGLNDEEDLLISYSEIPWFPGGQFCISVISTTKNNQLRIVKQTWDNEYDLNRFSSGVYNLDRLCIKKEDIEIFETQQNQLTTIINSISQLPNTLNDENYITLDGIDYQLTLRTLNVNKDYQWKVATKYINNFEPLINFLLTNTCEK